MANGSASSSSELDLGTVMQRMNLHRPFHGVLEIKEALEM